MTFPKHRSVASLALCMLLLSVFDATAQQVQPPLSASDVQTPQIELGLRFEVEPHALDLLRAMSSRLAAAKTMMFTATTTYESPDRTGQPLAYTTLSRVALQRPNKLRVLTPYDGAPSEFYYDGNVMTAFSPEANLAAVSDAPPTIDAMLKAAHDSAAIYFPFTDLIVADPYKDMTEGLRLAFVVGQSKVVGHIATDIIVLATDTLQVQMWIGSTDHLPRMVRATFFDEPGNYRHVVELSDWQLDTPLSPDIFLAARAAKARRMLFAAPDSILPEAQAPGEATP